MPSQELFDAWVAFVDRTKAHRPDLHRFCRRMTRSVWDAEDLVQETLLRSFDHFRSAAGEIRNERGFLFRTATNAWIDVVRRKETAASYASSSPEEPARTPSFGAARDAGRALFGTLSPQERAAVVLKDALDLSLVEIAGLLETTVGAVKSALHRGRGTLAREAAAERLDLPRPPVEIVDRFVDAFNALDVAALAALLQEDVETDVLGCPPGPSGRDPAVSRDGWVQKSLFGHEPWALDTQTPARQQRAERRWFDGEPIVVVWMRQEETMSVEWMFRLETETGEVTKIRDYCLCPETQTEVAEALGVPLTNWGYRLGDEVLAWEAESGQ